MPARDFTHRLRQLLTGLVVPLLLLPAVLPAQTETIGVELNKLEPDNGACRAYLVVENAEAALASLRLDLVLFDPDGIIARRLAVETAPLPAGKTSVKVFSIDGLACGEISRVLLNGVLACEAPSGPIGDCLQRIDVGSVAGVPFFR